METSLARKIVGCIGKCTAGLSAEELDHVTDNIHKTLTHPKGRKIFKEYLRQAHRKTDFACLDFYEKCCHFIEKDECYWITVRNPSTAFLQEDVNEAMLIAEELDGVPEIDETLLRRYNDVLESRPSRDLLLSVLQETKIRLMNHLREAHRSFRTYVLEPCPATT